MAKNDVLKNRVKLIKTLLHNFDKISFKIIEIFTTCEIVWKHFLDMDDWASKLFSSSCKLWTIQRRWTSESDDGRELTSKLSIKEISTTSNENGMKYLSHMYFCFLTNYSVFLGYWAVDRPGYHGRRHSEEYQWNNLFPETHFSMWSDQQHSECYFELFENSN